jgi:hypothetical protein
VGAMPRPVRHVLGESQREAMEGCSGRAQTRLRYRPQRLCEPIRVLAGFAPVAVSSLLPHICQGVDQPRPFALPLFTRLRGIGILRSRCGASVQGNAHFASLNGSFTST